MNFFSKNSSQSDKEFMRLAFSAFAEMSGWVAVPVVIALFVGRSLDTKYDTGYLYFLSLTALAFVISCVGIGIVGMKYLKQVNKKDNQLEQNKESSDHDQRR